MEKENAKETVVKDEKKEFKAPVVKSKDELKV